MKGRVQRCLSWHPRADDDVEEVRVARPDLLHGAVVVVPCISPTSWELVPMPQAAKCPCALSSCLCWSDCRQLGVPRTCLQGGRALTLPCLAVELGSSPGAAISQPQHHSPSAKGTVPVLLYRRGPQGTECLQGNLLHSHPSLNTFDIQELAHPLCKSYGHILCANHWPASSTAPCWPPRAGSFWGGEGEAGWGSSEVGAAAGWCFTRELESCESVA